MEHDKPFTLHASGQDSAIHLHEGESSQSQQSTANPSQQISGPTAQVAGDASVTEESEDPFASDSGFDSGSLLGDDTDTLASTILNFRLENGRHYHSYRCDVPIPT
jgi:hypothetical protein